MADAREPHLCIRDANGRVLYNVRLDHLLRIEMLHGGLHGGARALGGALTFEIVETALVPFRATYTTADFPRRSDG